MHPIERLRYVARASGAPAADAARESIRALTTFHDDPHALLTACRRLVNRHPHSGPMLFMASHVLTASDPRAGAEYAARLFDRDSTADDLAYAIAEDATIVVLGWPDVVSGALVRRGDVEVLAVDVFGEATGFVRRLRGSDNAASVVPVEGVASAIIHSDLVLLESTAIGPTHFLGVAGSFAAASVANAVGVPVWLVGGVGRLLPQVHWEALAGRAGAGGAEPWSASDEIVPLDVVDLIVGPGGPVEVRDAFAAVSCPVAPELLVLPED